MLPFKENMQRTLSLLLAVTCFFPYPTNSVPLNKDETKLSLKKICKDSCSSDSCYTSLPGECHQYLYCYRYPAQDEFSLSYVYTCPLGQVWEQGMLTCRPRDQKSTCLDKCADGSVVSYNHGPFCNQYYMCVNGISEPMCCQRSHAFIDGQCVPKHDCVSNCPSMYAPVEITTPSSENITTSIAPETTTEMCTRSAVIGSPSKFIINDINITSSCARGTVFDQSVCDCVLDAYYVPSTDCYPEMVINYENKMSALKDLKKDFHVRKYGGAGLFSSKDKSASKINHYSGNSNILKSFNMTVIFKSDSTGDKTQFLITNCRSTSVDRPSIGIMVSNINGTLLFVADDNATAPYDSIVKMTVKFKKGSWNWVRYIFDGQELNATVIPLPDRQADPSTLTDPDVYTNKVTLPSETVLLRSQNPLTFGYCNNHGFDGVIYLAQLAGWVCSTYVDSKNDLNGLL
ncbi:uncharacterized protein LOC117343567 [Pecten maximus]|uniref:uncharacterized protein LOC117343567 n=1 Tax=Pecten maximus TaxID=6579 RepID=UPI001458B83A|nr:uncharacterized protein LOC117343567 [Pecten maximus]